MTTDEIIQIIKAEPEYPDPCPKLRAFIAEAVANKDADHVLHMIRQAVRQTKDSLISRLHSPTVRTSIVGDECTACGAIQSESLKCPGCGWADPVTRKPSSPNTKLSNPHHEH